MRLLISYSGVLGGAERALVDFADALGTDTCLACPPGAHADAARARGLRVFVLPDRGLELRGQRVLAAARLAAHARETRALIEALEPELVPSSCGGPVHRSRARGPAAGRMDVRRTSSTRRSSLG